jgi:hypothetical protein
VLNGVRDGIAVRVFIGVRDGVTVRVFAGVRDGMAVRVLVGVRVMVMVGRTGVLVLMGVSVHSTGVVVIVKVPVGVPVGGTGVMVALGVLVGGTGVHVSVDVPVGELVGVVVGGRVPPPDTQAFALLLISSWTLRMLAPTCRFASWPSQMSAISRTWRHRRARHASTPNRAPICVI